jgi:hypothetical protein
VFIQSGEGDCFVVFPFVSSNMHEIMLFELLDFPVPA